MLNLIKAGCFDELEPHKTRLQLLEEYLHWEFPDKKALTTANLPQIVARGLIPDDYSEESYSSSSYDTYTNYSNEEYYDTSPSYSSGLSTSSYYSNKILNTDVETYAKGKVDIGHAKANAGLEMALKNEKGEFSPHLSMEAGLELALLKLEGSVGAKMMGVGVEAQLSFIAGLVAKGNVKFSGWQLEIELEAALGIGVGVKLKLDFSDLKDKLVDLAKETGGKIADVMCEKLCRWGFYSQREMWYDLMKNDIESLFKEGEGLMNQDERVTT